MKTVKNTLKFKLSTLLLLVVGISLTSCSNEEAILKTPGDVVERIDMVLENNNDKEYIYLENEQANTTNDLVNYNFYGNTAKKMDFKLQIDESRTLIFTVHNSNQPNFWELENTEYSLHPNQDLNSTYKYVTAEIISDGEINYTSSLGSAFPRQVETDVFRIMKYDPTNHEMLVHIENFPVARESASSIKTLLINGTFRGSLTFNN